MFNVELKQGKGETTLIVEDDEDVLSILREILSKTGYAVLEARNTKEAYSIFKKEKNKIRLVISDVVLPDGSGVKLVEEMITQSPNLKVILSSGYPSDEVDLAETNKKRFLFLQKPYILTELLMTIREILD
ncbi:MAG: response regulator [Candidatus Desulfofervidaceae bacterium]|nr:response regulator [Candidatus Desulfofervidaceae bacterium]